MKKSRLLGAVCAFAPLPFQSLLINVSTAVRVLGRPRWQGRDLDGDLTTAEAYYDTVLDITWLANTNAC